MAKKIDLYVALQSYRTVVNKYPEFQIKADEVFEKTKDLKKVDEFCKKIISQFYAAKLKKQANMNRRFAERTFENFKIETPAQRLAFDKAKKYADNIEEMIEKGVNIVLAGDGNVGTGKTHLAYAIANSALNKGVPVKVINVTDLANDLKRNFDTQKYINVPVLLLDDLGKENGTPWICEAIYNILNTRYEQMKPVIITTENRLSDISKNYLVEVNGNEIDRGKSIISRLTENYVFALLTGDDYRHKRWN